MPNIVRPTRSNELWYAGKLRVMLRRYKRIINRHAWDNSDDIVIAVDAIESLTQSITDTEFAQQTAESFVNRVNKYNARRNKQIFTKLFGISADKIIDGDAITSDLIVEAIQRNADLADDLSLKMFEAGQTAKQWRLYKNEPDEYNELIDAFKKQESRTVIISRDQSSTINGALNEVRQKQMGVNQYIWRTSKDERVRDEHKALEGEKFYWNAPGSEGHPGSRINCRCDAEPVIDEF